MAIGVGDKLPEANFFLLGPDGPTQKKVSEIFPGKKVVLFAVPGAFTPTCHLKHMPGFVERADEIKAKGVDEIVCVTVNDVFVLDHWQKATGAEGRVLVLSDGNGEFTKAMGQELDGSAVSLGVRSKRYAAIVDDGTVTTLIVEDNPGVAEQSTAEEILKAL